MRRYLKPGWYNSLQFIIALACIVLSILPMVYTGLTLYQKFSENLMETSRVAQEQILEQLKINLEEYLEQGIKTTSDLNHLLSQNDFVLDSELKTDINMFFSTKNNIVSMSMLDTSGEMIFTVPSHKIKEDFAQREAGWVKDIIKRDDLYIISKPHVQNTYYEQHPWVITIATPIKVSIEGRQKESVLLVDMSLQGIHSICSNLNLGGRGYVYLMDEDGELVYHPQQAVVASKLKDEVSIDFKNGPNSITGENLYGEEQLIMYKTLSFVDWNIVGVSYLEEVTSRRSKVMKDVMLTIPIILMVIIWLSWFISGKISLPIMKLQRYMHKVEEGNLNIELQIPNGEREVQELADTFNKMVKQIKRLIEENHKEQEAKRQTELEALQSQINPHFLYNTLDSIMWMAEGEQNEEVVDLVTSLARFFRISISKGASVISVREELEHAKSYLLIQQIRYKDKFDFTITADEQVQEYRTIKLILQPLIENAIYHGIEYMVDKGHIHIEAYIDNDFLVFKVEDNGLGVDEERLEELRQGNYKTTVSRGNGVGMQNVVERIRLKYGSPYGLTIDSEIEEGTLITLRLPLIGGEDEHVG